MKVQDLYRAYKKAAEITNKYEEMLDREYSEEIEKKFDKAYGEEYKALINLIDEVKALTKVDTPTAREMIHNEKFAALMSLTIA